MDKINVGIYGTGSHQPHGALAEHPRARLAATAAFSLDWLPEKLQADRGIRHYATLGELLSDGDIQLVSLCSPRRRDQSADAIRCLEAGKHVYAEKPCAFSEWELDAILEASRRTGMQFHEMAGTAFENPYHSMRELVRAGAVGEVVQVLVQKSYPYFDGRPQDEDIDGGLLRQVAIHAVRLIEHVACCRVKTVEAAETGLGNPQKGGGLRMAASLLLTLENGGVASAIANYLNPKGFGKWGNELLRVFGTKGFAESTDSWAATRLVTAGGDFGSISPSMDSIDYFDFYINSLLGLGEMPLASEEELHPTRVVIRAKDKLERTK